MAVFASGIAVNSCNGFSPGEQIRAHEWLKVQGRTGRRTKGTKCCVYGQAKGVRMVHSEDCSEPYGDPIDCYTLCFT